MDREHPIPQEVSTYEFRLVGDMTIKQFMQVAAGALISLVLYSSNLAPYVKWPLIIISFLAGIALAFFPIEDRPLSKWIVLFVKAIYSPTIYVWDKKARKYDFFQAENSELPLSAVAPAPLGVSSQGQTTPGQLIQNPLPSTQPVNEFDKLDKEEEEFLSKVNLQFISPPIQVQDNATPVQVQTKEVKDIQIPKTGTVTIEAQPKQMSQPAPPEYQTQSQAGGQVLPIAAQKLTATKSATFSQEAAPPSPPTKPNVIVGQVLDPEGKIIDGAILEIKDSEGRSVRALRSNRLGHFMIVTPLVNGHFQITTEKEGYIFDPVSFEAEDRVIPPIAIWAKS